MAPSCQILLSRVPYAEQGKGKRLKTGPEPDHRSDSGEVAALLRGLRLGFIALISAAVMAGLVISFGDRSRDQANPYYGDLVRIAAD